MSESKKHHMPADETPLTHEMPLTHEARIAILEREVATITERMQHLATKEDNAAMEARIYKELANVRAEIAELKAQNKADKAELKAANKEELAQMETRMVKRIADSEGRITRFLTITMIGFATITFSALATVIIYMQNS